MSPPAPTGRTSPGDDDRLGFDHSSDWIREALGRFVPQVVARRAVSASVELDRDELVPGESVELTIRFRNRLPVPVTLVTPKRRLWGWTVDGELAAADDRPYTRSSPSAFVFRGRERKTVTRRWDGRFLRTNGGEKRWVDAEAGDHRIEAFVATKNRRPRATTAITVRRR